MDKNRFYNELKLVFAENWKLSLSLMAVVFLISFGATLLSMDFFASYAALESRASGVMETVSFFTAIIACYTSAVIFGNLTDKSHQIRLLMTPSSVREKYWARVLYTLIVVILISDAVAYSGMLLWEAFQSEEVRSQTMDYLLGVKMYQQKIFSGLNYKWLFVLGPLGSFSTVMIYAVGATYFRKHPFIMTSIIGLTAFLLLMFCVGLLIGFCISYYQRDFVRMILREYLSGFNFWLIVGVLYAMFSAIFCYWSYRRFVKLQYASR